MSEKKKILLVTGKRKRAIAKAVIRPGAGRITVNRFPIEVIDPPIARMKMLEPVILAGDRMKNVDVKVRVSGGGFMGQAEAVRTAVARGLVDWSRSSELRKIFTAYDRTMLAGDPRRTEPKKFGGPGPRARKQKSYR